ncbi:MAG: hypothetical protein EWM72_02927 [Nitrospira sp.]|nr:MAG: hypothetical protein EWM72_02927 [Nitrospira sp.]
MIPISDGGQRSPLDRNLVPFFLGTDRILVKPSDQKTFMETVREVFNGRV